MMRKVYQRFDSLPEQIQPTFGIEVSNHVTCQNRGILAFSYSRLVSKRSPVRFWGNLTPLQVGSCFRLEAGDLEELGE